MTVASAVRRIAVDTTPLRTSRGFRLLWLGELVSETGSNITVVAVYIQVFQLTDSALAVGVIGLVQLAAVVLTSVFGAPLIDRSDRRRLLIGAHFGQAFGSLVLLGTALAGDPSVVFVYAGAAIVAGLSGIALSTRSAMIPNLVPAPQLSSALALNQVMWNTSLIAGPALGGIVVGGLGLSWAYGIDLASFAATIAAALLMMPMPPKAESAAEVHGWRGVTEGFRFLRGRRVLQSTFIIDLIAMIFGMPRALFPVLALVQFEAGSEVVGFLFSAVAIGALLAALSAGWVRHIRRQGVAVLIAVAVWGSGIAAFGLVGDRIWAAFACLAVAGAADVVSAVFRSTILQRMSPDDLRGRLAAIHILVVTGGPRLGDFEAGAVAAITTPTVSVVSGGLICILGVVAVALAVPEFVRYRDDEASDRAAGTLRRSEPGPERLGPEGREREMGAAS